MYKLKKAFKVVLEVVLDWTTAFSIFLIILAVQTQFNEILGKENLGSLIMVSVPLLIAGSYIFYYIRIKNQVKDSENIGEEK